MKKGLGIIRNQTQRILALKKEAHRKKNRFQIVGKDDMDDYHSNINNTQLVPSLQLIQTPLVWSNSQKELNKPPEKPSNSSNRHAAK